MSHPRLRAVLETVAAYTPAAGLQDPADRPSPLSANESPHTPLPGIAEAVARAGTEVNRYPDPGCGELIRALARAHGTTEDHVAVGAGSVALLQTLFHAVAEPGAEAVHAWPSFEVYPTLAALSGATAVPVPLREHSHDHDLRAMADRITDRTRLVIVCNPNNPTGTLLGHEELRKFVAAVPRDCLVAVDEAYHEYVRGGEPTGALGLIADHPNLVVLRTFSKAYGLAGLRTGYLIGDPWVVERLRKASLPYAVNSAAQEAAVAALGLAGPLLARVEETVAERTRVREALLRQGWTVPDSQANFVWLPLGPDTADFGAWCAGRRVAVRAFAGVGVRVSIGTAEDDDRFLAAADAWRGTRKETGA
ncbi:histidinol-phosphate transaminase [Streptomyces sp. NPDC048659]|uniref:histidinol-phosphate transaminase n=1 Tax=Streptomyces sp. NPDC048659 TaxID=3155489 RepID=UPI00342449C4